MNTLFFVLLGSPGSGKGTQAEFLKKKGFLHLSTGEILRAEIKGGTELGKKSKTFIDKGELVPDDLINAMTLELLDKKEGDSILLDGYPRSLVQAEALDFFLDNKGRKLDGVLYLDLSVEESKKRLAGRYFCPACKKNYNIFFSPPKEASLCDSCRIALVQRSDDREDVVAERIGVYFNSTLPLVDYYERKKKLIRIPASLSPEDVSKKIGSVLENGRFEKK